jgi:ferritin-like metal-binding protein YciE
MTSFPARFASQGNLSTFERWLSLLGGIGLLASAARGSSAGRLARGSVGLSLLARGAAGHCAMKAALTGESSLSDGLKDQWQQLTSQVSHIRESAEPIDSLDSLYSSELQELHSAEAQFCSLAETLRSVIGSPELAFRIEEYSTELKSRQVDLESLLARVGADVTGEADDAMQALVDETHKMAAVADQTVRDAAVTASLQRIIHYKIAGYGTIAAYAKALGRNDEAGHFAQLADRDKAIDAELTELAKGTLNPKAAKPSSAKASGSAKVTGKPMTPPESLH